MDALIDSGKMLPFLLVIYFTVEWFERKFGAPFRPLASAAEMLGRYASKTHSVGARLAGDEIEIIAPFGLDDIFSFRVVPNHALANRAAHEAKGAKARSIWPEVSVVPWG